MGVSKNNGTPKWMVKIMENPIGVPLFLETSTYLYTFLESPWGPTISYRLLYRKPTILKWWQRLPGPLQKNVSHKKFHLK